MEPTSADTALEIGKEMHGGPVLVVNAKSNRAAVVLPAPSGLFDDGGVQERVRLLRPAGQDSMAKAEFDASNWRKAAEAEWRALWEDETAGLPSHRESRFWLAAGLLLPVWERLLAENMRVRRLRTDDGEALIACVLDFEQVRTVCSAFSLAGGPASRDRSIPTPRSSSEWAVRSRSSRGARASSPRAPISSNAGRSPPESAAYPYGRCPYRRRPLIHARSRPAGGTYGRAAVVRATMRPPKAARFTHRREHA